MNQMNAVFLALIFTLFSDISFGAVPSPRKTNGLAKSDHITIPFMENKGQLKDPNILYYANTLGCLVFVHKDGSISYDLTGSPKSRARQFSVIQEKFGAPLKVAPSGDHQTVTKVSLFTGKNPDQWVKDAVTYNTVNVGEIHDGVRLKLKAHGNNVEKFFHIRPGTDPQTIQSRLMGIEKLQVTATGELDIDTGSNHLRFTKPVAFQYVNGRKTMVDVAYAVTGHTYGFQVAAYDKTRELIIDPLINTFFIGETDETTRPTCMAADSEGHIYIAGRSAGSLALFKLDSRGETLLCSALFSSASKNGFRIGDPSVYDIAVDGQNNIFLTGTTQDENFPVTDDAFDPHYDMSTYNPKEGFVIKFNSDLNHILAATYIGGDRDDMAYGLALDPDGQVYVVGQTESAYRSAADYVPFPTTPGAYDTDIGPQQKTKAFVVQLDNQLHTLVAATLLGSSEDDDALPEEKAFEVAVDADGEVIVAGVTQSARFPVTPDCADATFQGETEIFLAKFDANLQNLLASTFLGGHNDEIPNALTIDSNADIFVAGWTMSSDFPVVQGNYDTSYNLYEDGFVAKLDNHLTTIHAATFIGGEGADQVSDMVILADGGVLLCGGTGSINFPVTAGSHDESFNGGDSDDFYKGDGFITAFDATLTTCTLSSFLGGGYGDDISSILVNNAGIIATGETRSYNFPYMIERKGHSDAFISRFHPDEEPVPLPAGGPGHWQSRNSGSASRIHLDVNICEDGSFSGSWRMYFCMINIGCFINDSFPPNPVSGNFDFSNNIGMITLTENCIDLPFVIDKQSPEDIKIIIFPDQSDDRCALKSDLFSNIYYKGDNEDGICPDTPGPDDDNPAPSSNSSGGGSGGGCLINTLVQ